MSKIALQGDASGTGTFTIASPNSNTDRTLTLPDETGTVVTTAGASFTSDVSTTAQFSTNAQGSTSDPAYGITSGSIGVNGMYVPAANSLAFIAGATERMRIDASGHVLIGKTTNDFNTAGIALRSEDVIQITRSSAQCLDLNRQTSDGNIATFSKDGTQAGFIGTAGGGTEIFIGSAATNGNGVYFGNTDRLIPVKSGNVSDNTQDIGHPSYRWDDIYATNGTIQTSDRNEKQDIEELSEAEQRVAVAAKGLIRKFRWIDAVEEKGDDARIHFGIIAQDLQAAFEAEGLDAHRYAMFTSNTWWEAEETYTDDEGVEQTRIKTYDTADEAPEGATERTRLGVRYPELLAFIIGAL